MTIGKGARLGHYEIAAPLGAGGMGEIYLAQDMRLGRRVALKLLPAQFTADAERLRRFVLEAKAASALNHPNIITIYEVGEADAVHFIATEFIEGETLRQRMAQTRLSVADAVNIAQQIVSALAAAHEAGIVHRDIKPENVMIRRDGYVKVLDFGLAKLVERQRPASDPEAPTLALKTDPGKVMGTVSYMSPEQARGLEVDARSDLFSLGVVLYEMIGGRLPFIGQTPSDVLAAVLHHEPPPLEMRSGNLPAEVNWILIRLLAKDREERYQNSKSLFSDLRRVKQRLEFEVELGRAAQAAAGNDRTASLTDQLTAELPATSNSQTVAPPLPHDPFRTDINAPTVSNTVSNTSSAEYLIMEIKRRRRGLLTFMFVLLVGLAGLSWWAWREKPLESLAVLPFINATNDPDLETLGDNLTARLINQLSQLPNLKVKSLSVVSRYKNAAPDMRRIGSELEAQAILTGRIAKRGGDFVINIELVRARDNTTIWGEQYQHKFAELLLAEQEITRDVAERLRVALTRRAHDQQHLAAQQLSQQARYYWNQRTADGLKKALDLFQQALARDPDYAQALAGEADCYNLLAIYNALPSRQAFPKAKAAALRALEQDGTLAEAHAALGMAAYLYDWDWLTAEQEFKRALALNPTYASAHQWYATLLFMLGRNEEAVAEARRTQALDPLSLIINAHLGRTLYFTGQYDEAVTQLQKTLALDPGFFPARRYLGQVYAEQGKFTQAIAELTQSVSLSGGSALVKAELAQVYAVAGRQAEARQIVAELSALTGANAISPYHLAVIYAGLRDKDQAFAMLQKAYDERADRLAYLGVDPRLKPLRNDPRFTQMLRRIGL
ncbi:MAG: protein kinase [Acidobacteria bacterium]|nr:protein kinase [Acidobacteriota bacterium]MBI3425345.1 protein kinase [Acidobacteriota bacterium]